VTDAKIQDFASQIASDSLGKLKTLGATERAIAVSSLLLSLRAAKMKTVVPAMI
jgi:hypothetical protein